MASANASTSSSTSSSGTPAAPRASSRLAEHLGSTYAPVIREERSGSDTVNWGEFVEAGYLREYRAKQVSLPYLRPVIAILREELGVVSVAATMGLAVPEDLMIASSTDTEHSRGSSPPVTALDLRHEELASSAVDLVFKLLSGEQPPTQPIVIRPRLLL